MKRKETQQKQEENFRKSYQKFCGNQQLSVADMRTILQKFKEKSDSPLKTKAIELRQQWHNRNHRLNVFVATPVIPTVNNIETQAVGMFPHDPVLDRMEREIFEPTGSGLNNSGEIAEQTISTDVLLSHQN
jgi:hypothetical protein